MNKVILVGRLTKDPELRYTPSNIAVVRFTIAVNRTYQTRGEERQADFISCIAWRQQAENLSKFMRKGSLIGVDGQIQTSSFDDQNGVRRYVTEVLCNSIQFLEPKSSTRSDDFSTYQETPQYERPRPAQAPDKNKNPFEDITSDFDISNDDLPF